MHTPTPAAPAAAQPQAAVDINDSEDLSKIRAISLVAVGVVALFSYFFHIDYFPLFDLQAASSYLFAVTWVLAVLLIALALTLLVPYVIIGMTLKTRKTPRGERRLTSAIVLWMSFGMLTLIGLSAGFLLTVWLELDLGWGLVMALVFSLLLCGIRTHHYVKKIKKRYSSTIIGLWNKKIVRKLFISQLGTAVLSGFLQLMPLMVLFLMFSRASGLEEDDYLAFLVASAQCAMFIAIVGGMALHVILIPRHRKHWWIALCLLLVLPWMVNGLARAPGMLPMAMAQLTKIGNFRAEKLILSPAACGSIAPILGTDCDEKTSPPIQLCNVHVMSRIGPETYLRIAETNAGKDGTFPVRHIFLPTAQITSMQVDFERKNLRLALIDKELGGRSSACDTVLTTLHGDSAFGFNDFTLTDSGKAQLLAFIQEIKNGARGIEEIKVTGHSDQIGATKRNVWLSTRRAQEVKLFLNKRLKNLVPEIKVNATSQGSTQPLIKDCGTLPVLKERINCEAPNRRVELEIVKKAPVKPT